MSRFNSKLSRVLNEVWGRGRRLRSRVKEWHKEPGTVPLEIGIGQNGMPYDLAGDELPQIANLVTQEGELIIHFESSGYSDPGNGWDYAPEGEDNRYIVAIDYLPASGQGFRLPKEVFPAFQRTYSDAIDAAAVEVDDRGREE